MHLPNQPFSRSQISRSNRRQVVVLALALAFAARAAALEPIKTYATLMLRDGRQLSSVEVVTYTTTDVLVRHAGGATSLRSEVLPDHVIAELHLPAPQAAQPIVYDAAFLALADKPAMVDAHTAPAAARPTSAVTVDTGSNVSAEQLAAAALPAPRGAPSAPAGEGNVSEFAGGLQTPTAAATSAWATLAGRIAVALPEGETHLLADVEVRAYPSELLAKCLPQARAQGAAVAQKYRELAAVAAQEGRAADAATFTARANQAADHYLDFMPLAPYSARSDAYGHFTLRHDLRDARLVAVGRVNVPRGAWSYSWGGVAPGEDAHLSEANATLVTPPGATGPRFAAQ